MDKPVTFIFNISFDNVNGITVTMMRGNKHYMWMARFPFRISTVRLD